MLPTGLDFLRCLRRASCSRARCRCRSTRPLRLDRLEEYAARQSAILADAGVALLVTIARARPVAGLLTPRGADARGDVVTADELAAAGRAGRRRPTATATDPAFIQYTSGSTGQPKGVLLTHANLLANIRAIGERAARSRRPTSA